MLQFKSRSRSSKNCDSLSVFVVGGAFQKRDAWQEENDERGEDGGHDGDPLEALNDVEGDGEDAPPENDLAEVVRVAGQPPQAWNLEV